MQQYLFRLWGQQDGWAKAPVAKPDDWSSVLGTYVVEGQSELLQTVC